MVGTIFEDNKVRLLLDDQIVLEQDSVTGITIGTYTVFEDEEVQKKDYDAAFVGKGASLTDSTVNSDGFVYVDDGGKLGLLSVDGGTVSGAPLCENFSRWYGARSASPPRASAKTRRVRSSSPAARSPAAPPSN